MGIEYFALSTGDSVHTVYYAKSGVRNLRTMYYCPTKEDSVELAEKLNIGSVICRGCATLGTACGTCAVCIHTMPKDVKSEEWPMYRVMKEERDKLLDEIKVTRVKFQSQERTIEGLRAQVQKKNSSIENSKTTIDLLSAELGKLKRKKGK